MIPAAPCYSKIITSCKRVGRRLLWVSGYVSCGIKQLKGNPPPGPGIAFLLFPASGNSGERQAPGKTKSHRGRFNFTTETRRHGDTEKGKNLLPRIARMIADQKPISPRRRGGAK